MDEAVELVAGWIRTERPSFATFTSVHGVMESTRSPAVRTAHRAAGLVACDGMPIVWASRFAGVDAAERVYGPDFMLAFCELAEREGWSSFFYGGKEGIPEELVRRLRDRFPRLAVAGVCSPPFRALTPDEDAAIVRTINESGADIVWVGLSTPKQERWMADHVGRLRAPAMLGVGAAFAFHAGAVRQAPRWMQRSGLEWVFRLLREPRRLAGRYLRNNPAFVARIVRHPPRLLAKDP
jgi:N-acetylglucosaminyldiphosphoundecaprenol N-acetyl-beta-D-mannosaminyltransferase